jgi:transporter family protein
MWIIYAIISSVFLGIYAVFKKTAVNNNAVIPVLFFSTLSSAILFVPFIIASNYFPDFMKNSLFFVPTVNTEAHIKIFIKAVIVVSSWILAYFSLKHLPITIVASIRASAPIWVLIGALILFGEKLNSLQWLGLVITIVFYYIFSLVGNREGIQFRKNKWILFIILATIIGAISALYDKYLISILPRMAIQAYFLIYMAGMLLIVILFLWLPRRKTVTSFKWNFSIPLVGITLVIADFLYFFALSQEGSLISIISILRRSSVILTFIVGAFLFKEKNKLFKGMVLLGILIGIFLIIKGS